MEIVLRPANIMTLEEVCAFLGATLECYQKGDGMWVCTGDIWRYDPTEEEWHIVASKPEDDAEEAIIDYVQRLRLGSLQVEKVRQGWIISWPTCTRLDLSRTMLKVGKYNFIHPTTW